MSCPLAVSWTHALSSGSFTLPLCPSAQCGLRTAPGLGHGRGVGDLGGVAGIVEAHGASQDRCNSVSLVGSAPAVADSSLPRPEPSLRDLVRLFFSPLGSCEQWEAVAGSALLAAAVSGAGSLPGPAAPKPVAAPSACSSVRVSRWWCFCDRFVRSAGAF